MLKRFLSLLLVAALALAFCGISFAEEEPVEIEMFISEYWFPLREWAGAIPEKITEKTGVKLNITVAADYNQLPVLVANGDAPELVFTSVDHALMANSDICYDWGSLIEQYCPDWEVPADVSALYKQSDGKFYTIRNAFSSKEEWEANDIVAPNTFSGLALNDQVMEELGNPEIKSIEDLEAVFDQVHELHPDMPVILMYANWWGSYFAEQLGARREAGFYTEEDDATVKYWIEQPEQLDFYKLMNRFYRKGFINAENFAFTTDDDCSEYVLNGNAFALSWIASVAGRVNSSIAAAGGNSSYTTIKNMLTDKAKFNYTSNGWAGVYITKNCKNPEAAIKMLQYLFTEEGQHLSFWGIEGEDYTMNEAGYPDFIIDVNNQDALVARGLNNFGLFSNSGVTEALGGYIPGSDLNELEMAQKPYINYQPMLGLLTPEMGTEEYDIMAKIDEMVKNEQINIYTAESEEECVAAYEHMLKTAQSMGIETLDAFATARYAELKAN